MNMAGAMSGLGGISGATGNGGNMNVLQLMQEYRKFRGQFNGDARQTINELVQSGKVSNEQVQRVSQMAQFLQRYM